MYGQYRPLRELLVSVYSGRGGGIQEDLRIGLASNVNFVSLHGKGIDEIFVETHELLSDIVLILGSNFASGEASVNGLLNPQDISKMMPAPRVWYRLQSTILPQEGTVFLQETFE